MREIRRGSSYPIGPTVYEDGVNFSLFSQNATAVYLELYEFNDSADPKEVIELKENSAYVWHQFVSGIKPGDLYGFRVDGPYKPELGHRFNKSKLLIDPYAKALSGTINWSDNIFGYDLNDDRKDLSKNERDDAKNVPKSVVTHPYFDWKGTSSPKNPWNKTMIYELHVKGFTKLRYDIDSNIAGTYRGLTSDRVIQYLKDLGITTVELMPVHHHADEMMLEVNDLTNYWGYNTIAFFAPDIRYSVARYPGSQIVEFKEMVRTLHENDIEVILDVVYNHTAEGNQLGPTLSFRGIDNASYYRLSNEQPRFYYDFTGTGNSLDARQPHVLQLIMDSLRYWITEMHVDGFRFDLASALARELYDVDKLSGFFDIIHQDPVISQVKLIAEPWDVGPGGYQVGNFPLQWAEWNGQYRDSMRRYWRDDKWMLGDFGKRLSGSSDLYENIGKNPYSSINYITSHDGFTMRDLVSYEEKHNEANLQNNSDGTDENYSENFGVEGDTDDPEITWLRDKRIRNYLLTLFTSQGSPMLLAGDEILRTQKGNNNAYCQDNEMSWVNWEMDERKESLLEFTKRLIALRKLSPVFHRRNFFSGQATPDGKDLTWLRPDGSEMSEEDWVMADSRPVAAHISGQITTEIPYEGEAITDGDVVLLFNPSQTAVEFKLPETPKGSHIYLCTWDTKLDEYPRKLTEGSILVPSDSSAVIVESPP
ncbi:glycogen debranching protein [uncultured archaeon]|nr:glycogen debranching protein [uncultured archaeon]